MPIRLPEELQYIQNSFLPQKSTDERVDGKICLITGATSGIGLAATQLYARNGAELILVCRSEHKAKTLKRQLKEDYRTSSSIILADFNRLDDVRNAASEILHQNPKIDILINNAGIFNKRRNITPDGNEQVFQVVHLAAFLLTRLLEEPLNAASTARVIMVNSEAHRFGGLKLADLTWKKRPYIGLQAYGAAKIAQILSALTLAELWETKGITVNLVHPGAVRSNIGMNNNFFYRFYSKYILSWFLKDVSVAANAIYYLGVDSELAGITGAYFNLTNEEKPASYILDATHRKQIWELSNKLIGLGE